jgi:hypothetical protein
MKPSTDLILWQNLGQNCHHLTKYIYERSVNKKTVPKWYYEHEIEKRYARKTLQAPPTASEPQNRRILDC